MSNPIKQRTPDIAACPEFKRSNGKADTTDIPHLPQCFACAFFELVTLQGSGKRQLCHFTGQKNPIAGSAGCHFIAGNWQEYNRKLEIILQKAGVFGKVEVPNCMRPCSGLDCSQDDQKVARHSTAIHAYADIDGNKALHIGRAQRPGSGDTRAASYRPGSVGALPFVF